MIPDSPTADRASRKRVRGTILVIRGGAIGDFILTFPVFTALRRHFPETQLDVLGYPHIAQLAVAGGLVDQVRPIDSRPLASFFAAAGPLDKSLADYFAGCAVIVSYLYDPDGIFRANLARCSKAQVIACPHRPDENLNLHATEVFLKPLERLAIFDADAVPRLNVGPSSRLPLESVGPTGSSSTGLEPGVVPSELEKCDARPTLALHPGSGSEKKNWPEERWRELIRQLIADTNLSFLLVGGEAEGDRLSRLSAILPAARLRVAQNLSLTELAQRLQRCQGMIGHDSGITHLAAALGLPGLVLWGETNPAVWRPRHERTILLRHSLGLPGITVGSVMERLPELLTATGFRG